MKKLFTATLVLLLCISGLFANGSTEAIQSTKENFEWEKKGTPLSDARVRQALRYAIDLKSIVDELFEGKASVAEALIPVGPWLDASLEPYDYNPDKAKALLREAGWPSNYTLDVVYYYADQQTVDLMTIIQQYWAAIGVKSKMRRLEGDIGAQVNTPPKDRVTGPSGVKWDLMYGAISALSNNEFYDRFASEASNNATLPKQKGLDELILATRATVDVNTQKKAFYAIENDFNENMYAMPLYHQLAFIFLSSSLDIAGSGMGNDQFSYEKNILDWKTTRSDGMIYTNGGPKEYYEATSSNPGFMLYQELLFDKLINCDAELIATDGMLAKNYSISPDGMTIVFNLRNDAKWHDGIPFTADDIPFTVKYYMKTPTLNAVAMNTFTSIKGAKAYLDGSASDISGIEIEGNKVTITFDTLDPNALLTFSQWPILPEHLLADSNPLTFQQDQFWQHPIGTGPFKIANTNLGNYCILERNKDYYKKGTGNVEKIFMHASSENDANLLKNAEGGKIDYAFSKSVADAKGIEKLSNMKSYPINIRYTRAFFINQFPHEANIK